MVYSLSCYNLSFRKTVSLYNSFMDASLNFFPLNFVTKTAKIVKLLENDIVPIILLKIGYII